MEDSTSETRASLTERLRNRAFRIATRDMNGDGAQLALEAAERIEELEQTGKAFVKASWELRNSIDKWGRIYGDVSGVSAAHHKALTAFDAALAPIPPQESPTAK